MYSFFRFLRISPYDDFRQFKAHFGDDSARAVERLQLFLGTLMIRRTKTTIDQATGKPLIKLPKKTVLLTEVHMTKEERTRYIAVEMWKDKRLQELEGDQRQNVIRQMVLLLRLRQGIC
jgi:hypothetical protein